MRASPTEISEHYFAEAIRDEQWRTEKGRFELVSRRLDQGCALTALHDRRGSLEASSTFSAIDRPTDVSADLARTLAARVSAEQRTSIRRIARSLDRETLVRLRHTARFVARGGAHYESSSLILILESATASITTSPELLESDLDALAQMSEPVDLVDLDYRSLPILWRSGSAGVLLHEAIGHRSQHHEPAIGWPNWLHALDDPSAAGLARLPIDDTAARTQPRDLLRGERPSALRRQDYRHPPMPRMTNLVVTHSSPSFGLPERRIEVLFAHDGEYDPLVDEIRLLVTARVVGRESSDSLVRLVIHEPVRGISQSLVGARGEPIRFPGLLCADEGQRITAGCFAPEMLTRPFEQCAKPT